MQIKNLKYEMTITTTVGSRIILWICPGDRRHAWVTWKNKIGKERVKIGLWKEKSEVKRLNSPMQIGGVHIKWSEASDKFPEKAPIIEVNNKSFDMHQRS